MNLKRLFIVTYYVHFESDKNSKHDRFTRFWIWNAPVFINWVLQIRKETESKVKANLVVVNCGKFR